MNLETLQEIKNEYAQEQGYEDWENLQSDTLSDGEEMEEHMNEICIRAQKALKKPIYAKIDYYKELAEKYKDNAYNNRKYTYKVAGLEDALRIVTNPENLIR